MFTGLVEEIGTLRRAAAQGESMVLAIGAKTVLEGVKLGDSIAINGVCLTVTSWTNDAFTVDVTPQTYRHTTLKDLRPGSPVNLERAMPADGRFGGHIVQGHSDGVGTIVSRQTEGNAVWFDIRPDDPDLHRYIVPRGSVTVDGISLTVARTDGMTFGLSIIPHTLALTALQFKSSGDRVNLECDILGKYIEHLMRYGPKAGGGAAASRNERLTAGFLAEHGFF